MSVWDDAWSFLTEAPSMAWEGISNVAGAAGDIVGGMGRMTADMVRDPTFLKAAALAGMGYYFAPEIGAWVGPDGAALTAAEANQIAAGSNWVQAGVAPEAVAQIGLNVTPEGMAALGGGATAIPLGSAAAAAEGAAVPLTSTIAPAAAAGAAGVTAADLAAAAGSEGLAAPAATNALAPAAAGVTAADLAAASGAEGLAAPATLGADVGALGAAGAGAAGAAAAGAAGGALGNALIPAALIGSGLLGAYTSQQAAQTQADAARYAADKAYQVYQEQKALQEPYRTAGLTAQNQLLGLLGLPGGAQGPEFGRYARSFGMSDFQADPGYAFRLSEGLKALEASRAARGGLLSGATGKALTRYGQEMGSQEYGNAFNRYQTERANRLNPLGSLTNLGQSAAANVGSAAGQYGTNVGNLATSGAAAQAAGQVGMTNALTGALGQYLNYSSNQDLANAIAKRNSMYGPY